MSDYVAQKTQETLETLAAVDARFKALGGELTDAQIATADRYAQQMMDQYGDTYTANGIGLETVKAYERLQVEHTVSEEVCDNVNDYLAIYCVILVLSFAIISVDGFSIGTNFSAVASCFNNIGPGFELVGATQNFSIYSDLSKIILSLDMLLGRLEIFPLLLLLSPDTWSRRR